MITFKELPGWRFTVSEVAMGIYEIRGIDSLGRKVERSGQDTDLLIQSCKNDALEIMKQLEHDNHNV